ncbi:hypothetical protein LCGC14_2436640 [marine sediment metagenome]|uniref:Uncharacterized protein n=1 Tax=marine sediment metagenome TaxID=412755 RepID=A0A0F9BKE5_9ZZZZ
MSDKMSDSLHLYFEPDDKMGQRFVRRAKALEQRAWWHRMSNEDIAAELSATFDLSLDDTRKIAEWILSGSAEEDA